MVLKLFLHEINISENFATVYKIRQYGNSPLPDPLFILTEIYFVIFVIIEIYFVMKQYFLCKRQIFI